MNHFILGKIFDTEVQNSHIFVWILAWMGSVVVIYLILSN